jgi:hypothetical protein
MINIKDIHFTNPLPLPIVLYAHQMNFFVRAAADQERLPMLVRSVKAQLRRDPLRLIPLLGALAAFGPLSIDMYLPSFPTLANEFGGTPGQVQLTLSAFFVGFALGQLFYGPLSDRCGGKFSALPVAA